MFSLSILISSIPPVLQVVLINKSFKYCWELRDSLITKSAVIYPLISSHVPLLLSIITRAMWGHSPISKSFIFPHLSHQIKRCCSFPAVDIILIPSHPSVRSRYLVNPLFGGVLWTGLVSNMWMTSSEKISFLQNYSPATNSWSALSSHLSQWIITNQQSLF